MGGEKIKFHNQLKTDTALTKIALILQRVERNLHKAIVTKSGLLRKCGEILIDRAAL